MKNQGFILPPKRITVNLSPADIRKSGSLYDLPVAIAVLSAAGYGIKMREPILFLGELGLDGSLRGVDGVLPLVLNASQEGIRLCIVPAQNRQEAALADGIMAVGGTDLKEVVDFLSALAESSDRQTFLEQRMILEESREKEACMEEGRSDSYSHEKSDWKHMKKEKQEQLDFCDIRGQFIPRRAIEIAVCGHHNLLFTGPPGSGKTALARRIPSIMPSLTKEESLEVTKIYSISNQKEQKGKIIRKRPFRSPHHTISIAAMIGGGPKAKPGEVSLAHRGVLFLDEFLEYDRHILDLMRQPLEEGIAVVSRNKRSCIYPADFMLVAAMNPCPCGYFPDRRRCFCTEKQIRKYQDKISGPMLDRLDLMVRVNPVSFEQLKSSDPGEDSGTIRARVERVREIQKLRFKKESYTANSKMNRKGLEKYCKLTEQGEQQLKNLFAKQEISARGYERILRVARTIADMDESDIIEERHLEEAAAFRFGLAGGGLYV